MVVGELIVLWQQCNVDRITDMSTWLYPPQWQWHWLHPSTALWDTNILTMTHPHTAYPPIFRTTHSHITPVLHKHPTLQNTAISNLFRIFPKFFFGWAVFHPILAVCCTDNIFTHQCFHTRVMLSHTQPADKLRNDTDLIPLAILTKCFPATASNSCSACISHKSLSCLNHVPCFTCIISIW